MKKFLTDIFSNPDNLTFSSKRAGGFISLFATIVLGFLQYTEPMVVMAGLVVAFFGLSSVDYQQFLKTNPTPVDPNTGDAPVNN